MPHTLDRYHVEPNPLIHGSISLTLTNSITHPGDPTWEIRSTLTIYEGITVSEPQLEVSISHA